MIGSPVGLVLRTGSTRGLRTQSKRSQKRAVTMSFKVFAEIFKVFADSVACFDQQVDPVREHWWDLVIENERERVDREGRNLGGGEAIHLATCRSDRPPRRSNLRPTTLLRGREGEICDFDEGEREGEVCDLDNQVGESR